MIPISIPLSNVERLTMLGVTYNPGSVAANTVADNATTLTVTGVCTDDFVLGFKPTTTAGLALVGARCSAIDTITFTFANVTGVAIDAGSETYGLLIIRRKPGTLPTDLT